MTPEQWQRLRDVLAEALERKPEHRPAFLDRAGSSDPALRREVAPPCSATFFAFPSTERNIHCGLCGSDA